MISETITDKLILIVSILVVFIFMNIHPLIGFAEEKAADSSSSFRCVKPNPDNRYRPSIDDGTTWTCTSDIKLLRLGTIVAGFAIFDAVGFSKISEMQYNTETSPFHFHHGPTDIREYKQMDKIGHIVESYWISHLTSKIYRWGGISASTSIWLGSLTGFIWMMQIEVTDGFFKAWGFSYYDLMMNIIGSGYSALQQFYPYPFKGIKFKVSYSPSQAYKKGLYSTVSKSWLDDYEGFTFWLAVNIYDVLPAKWQRSYPGWLAPWGISIGHGVQDIAQNVFNGKREIIIGLDFDLTKIPTGDNNLLKFIKDELNIVRLPLPAVCIYPTTFWFGFYFSQDI